MKFCTLKFPDNDDHTELTTENANQLNLLWKFFTMHLWKPTHKYRKRIAGYLLSDRFMLHKALFEKSEQSDAYGKHIQHCKKRDFMLHLR